MPEESSPPPETGGARSLKPLDKGEPITKARKILPHWTQDGCTYFVTFRLADSVAAPVWKKWREDRTIWLEGNPKPWDTLTQKDYNERFPAQMERWLDAGYGTCALQEHSLREVVTKSMHHFDGQRFILGDYVIMPNHIHVLITPLKGHELEDILAGWKRVSGHAILKLTGGPKPFWMSEDFDHVVRSERQLLHFQNYIAENPSKAKLCPGSWTHWKRP
jgi:REP element-mobilizing transposase RayT